MPGWFILAFICLVPGLLVLLVRVVDRASSKGRPATTGTQDVGLVAIAPRKPINGLGWAAAALLTLAAVFTFVSSYNGVGTKEEGIETSFGKTVGHLSNGPHLTWPWIKVHEMDAAIQTDSFVDNNGVADGCTAIPVRIANQQTGCASVSFQWRIRPNSAEELYKDYRSFTHVRDALVTRKLTAAVNEAFAHYNPLNSIASGLGTGIPSAGKGETLLDIGNTVTKIMTDEVGSRIEVLSTILPLVTFDQATQDRINQLQQQVALTRIATQEKETNKQVALANKALAKSVNTSPNVLVSRCFDALEAMVKTSQPVPAGGLSCWPGGGVSAIIAGPTK